MRGDWDHRGRAKQDESGGVDAAAKAAPLGAKIKTIVVWLGSGLTALVVVVFAFVAAYDVFSGSVYVHAHVPADMEELGWSSRKAADVLVTRLVEIRDSWELEDERQAGSDDPLSPAIVNVSARLDFELPGGAISVGQARHAIRWLLDSYLPTIDATVEYRRGSLAVIAATLSAPRTSCVSKPFVVSTEAAASLLDDALQDVASCLMEALDPVAVAYYFSGIGRCDDTVRILGANAYQSKTSLAVLVDCFDELGKYADVIRVLNELEKNRFFTASEAAMWRGKVFADKLRDRDAAAREFEQALASDSSNADAHREFMFLLQEIGSFDEAVNHALALVALDPENGEAYLYLGDAYVQKAAGSDGLNVMNREDEADIAQLGNAAAAYEKALELGVPDDTSWSDLDEEELASKDREVVVPPSVLIREEIIEGLIYVRTAMHQQQLARELLDSTVAARPQSRKDRAWQATLRAITFESEGQTSLAVAALETIPAQGRDADDYFAIGTFYLMTGRFDSLRQLLEEALARFPDDCSLTLMLAIELDRRERYDEAVERYLRCPADEYTQKNLRAHFWTHVEDANINAVVAYGRALAALAPDDVAIMWQMGESLQQSGRLEEAISAYETAVAARPTELAYRSNLAAAYFDVERYGEARIHLEYALGLDPADAINRRNLASVLYKTGETTTALGEIDAAIDLEPNDPTGHYMRGLILLDLNDREGAVAELRRALDLGVAGKVRETALEILQGREAP